MSKTRVPSPRPGTPCSAIAASMPAATRATRACPRVRSRKWPAPRTIRTASTKAPIRSRRRRGRISEPSFVADAASYLRHYGVGDLGDLVRTGGVRSDLLKQLRFTFGFGLELTARKQIVALDGLH